jgi:hypothetical protein
MDRAAGESFTKETVSRSSLAAGELGSFKASALGSGAAARSDEISCRSVSSWLPDCQASRLHASPRVLEKARRTKKRDVK